MMEKTYHASAATVPYNEIKKQNATVSSLKHIDGIFEALSNIIMILNSERQIIFSNQLLLKELGIEDVNEVLGKRPGNALSCINADKEFENGCGTSYSCRYCGVVNAVVESQKNKCKQESECRIIGVVDGKHFYHDLKVVASPFSHENIDFTVLSLLDISHEKRKNALERIFFHDIINIAGSLSSIMDILPLVDGEEKEEYLGTVAMLSKQVIDEIKAQQQLMKAENNELQVKHEQLSVKNVISKVVQQMHHHQVAQNKSIKIDENSMEMEFCSDATLLNRVLINMLKNALEATVENDIVQIGCERDRTDIRFWVHNSVVMSADVKSQVFQRSFSTKGGGRGLGTYSIKLLSEKYLGGKVGFSSEEGKGTCFFVNLPVAQ